MCFVYFVCVKSEWYDVSCIKKKKKKKKKKKRLSFLTFPCITNDKINESMIWQVTVGATVKFSLSPNFRDLLAFDHHDDLINILICIMTVSMN